jgi:hypothetical protein
MGFVNVPKIYGVEGRASYLLTFLTKPTPGRL